MHWKYWAILATVAWTLWGVAVKFALKRIDWARLEVLGGIAALVVMVIVAPAAYRLKVTAGDGIGFAAAIFGVAGAILFYVALSKGPVSVIIPLTSLYVVGVAAAGMLLFGEPFSWRKAMGVLLAAVAMALLAVED